MIFWALSFIILTIAMYRTEEQVYQKERKKMTKVFPFLVRIYENIFLYKGNNKVTTKNSIPGVIKIDLNFYNYSTLLSII